MTRLLIVDDDTDGLAVMCEVLRHALGHYVVGQPSMDAAAADLGTFDVLLADYTMGQSSRYTGTALVQSFKALNPNGVGIIMSGHYNLALPPCVDLFMPKPMSLESLTAALQGRGTT